MSFNPQDIELDAFKREIDLRQFAIGMGYAIDRRESWRGSAVMRRVEADEPSSSPQSTVPRTMRRTRATPARC